MKKLLLFLLIIASLSFTSEGERRLYKGSHPAVIGKVELVLLNKRSLKKGELNYVQIRGQLMGEKVFRLSGHNVSLKRVDGKNMFQVRLGKFEKDLTLTISIGYASGKVDVLKTIRIDRFISNK